MFDLTFRNAPQNLATPIGITIGGIGLTGVTVLGYLRGSTVGPAYNVQAGYIYGGVTVFASPGTTNWIRPSGCRAVFVQVIGGGGGSGGCAATGVGEFAESGGGGGGGYAARWITNPGASESVTVGAGGTAGTSGSGGGPGGTGGTTSFGSFVSATGGAGGAAGANSSGTNRAQGGVGGAGASGDVNVTGSDGGQGTIAGGVRIQTGLGGSSYFAGFRRQTFAATTNTGATGYLYGGGAAGGSANASQASVAGSPGAQGIALVHEFY